MANPNDTRERVLKLVQSHPGGISLPEIAKRIGITVGRVTAILASLKIPRRRVGFGPGSCTWATPSRMTEERYRELLAVHRADHGHRHPRIKQGRPRLVSTRPAEPMSGESFRAFFESRLEAIFAEVRVELWKRIRDELAR